MAILGVFLMPDGNTSFGEASNRYTHLFLVEKEYFGFNTYMNILLEDNHM
jgi:hypothetical protein